MGKRQLVDEKVKMVRVEVGHRRFELFERAIVLTLWLISIPFALVGVLSLPAAVIVAGSGLSAWLGISGRRRSEKCEQLY